MGVWSQCDVVRAGHAAARGGQRPHTPRCLLGFSEGTLGAVAVAVAVAAAGRHVTPFIEAERKGLCKESGVRGERRGPAAFAGGRSGGGEDVGGGPTRRARGATGDAAACASGCAGGCADGFARGERARPETAQRFETAGDRVSRFGHL
jgi:hypothetical protein